MGAQRRRVHDQHRAVELDHGPDPGLLRRRLGQVVPVGVDEQAHGVVRVDPPAVLVDLGLDGEPLRRLDRGSRPVLLALSVSLE
ncbi:hypothetical protein ACH9EU_00140 [Kocuria sp. M1R5S2]|uniref:hypothetical protein n=1 Tax=Kocuria rhizosphaerae TaxID=3376285 RepID=UPI00379FD62A